jgi:adenosylcobinamide-GDP ribazoletransferase
LKALESATDPGEVVAAPRQVALFLVATQFLTRVPVPSASDFQPQWLRQSLRYFPLVGGFVGLANVAVWWLSSQWFPRTVAVGLMLALSLVLTGAFHEDGFADTCDGFGGGATRERTLAIMQDSRIGAFGAIGLVMLLGLKWSALVALPTAAFSVAVVTSHVVSRWYSIGLVRALPYARAEGEGKSRPFDGGLTAAQWLLSGVIGVAAVAIPALWSGPVENARLAIAAAVGCAAAAGTALVAAAHFKRRIGGYTGDCLGAVQQLSELTFLLGALAVLRPAMPPG